MSNLKGVRQKVKKEEVEEEKSFMDKVKGLRDKFKLGPHHKMERFGVIVASSLVFLLVFTSISFVSHRMDVANLASSQAVFTDSFNFSLSGQKGSVEGIYGNKEKTDVMILVKFQNPHEMSADASNYELFVTGKRKKIKHEPKVSFSLFGVTGYGIIRFQDSEPLEKQILDITLRSNADLSSGEGRGSTEDTDGSFDKYDQAKIYANVGAENVEVLENVRTNEKDPSKLYIGLVASEKDTEIREKIDEKTKELSKLLNKMDEYTNRLKKAGYIPPATPWFVDGDYVDEDDVFRPNNDLHKAHSFDYWSMGISDGYVNQVVDSMKEFDDYMKEHSDVSSSTSGSLDEIKEERVDKVEVLKNVDGSSLNLDSVITGTSASAQVSAKDSLESLLSMWRDYLSTKSKLQKNILAELIVLDADVRSQPTGYSEGGTKYTTFY